MLFVFGKRAKQLRLNKVSELIHNSTNHRDLEMAKVSVFFQEIIDLEGEEYEVVPGSDFIISRTAHRSNKSDYYINDRKSNFTEVTDLLKGKGIDLDNNRFLILQGEVEQISMMKPKGQTEHETGLLDYLEDIIGTDKYIPLIEEGGKRLEELGEKRQGMLQRLKAAERDRDGLEAEKTAAEAYMSKELECLQAQSSLAQIFMHDAQRSVDDILKNIENLEAKLQQEKDKRKECAAALAEHETRYNAASKEYSSIQRELENASDEFKEFERKDIKFREDIKHIKAKIKKLEDKESKDTAKLAASEAELVGLQAAIPQLKAAAEAANTKLAPAEKALEDMLEGTRDEVEGLRRQLQVVRADLAPWQRQITEVRARMDVAVSERDLLKKMHDDAASRLTNAKEELARLTEDERVKGTQATEMEAQLGKLRSQVQRAERKEIEANNKVVELESSTKEIRVKAEQKKADAAQRASAGALITALMEARATNVIPGIYGRLGDLGAIDPAYDVAISTACGSLDYIVVDSTATAQRCVEFLRQRQLGVATFLILEKQAHLAQHAVPLVKCEDGSLPTPEGVPRLFDLVKCADPKVRLAFYNGLRDTLVANDLEQASRIAYGKDRRWKRVVTVKGELINDNGTMAGGGAKPKGGRMRLGNAPPQFAASSDSKEAAVELKTAEKELETVATSLKRAREELEDAMAEVKAAKLALSDVETSIPKLRLEAQAAKDRAEDLKVQMKELEIAAKMNQEDASRLKTLDNEIAAAEKELTVLQRKSQNLTQKATDLETAISEAGGERVKRQRDVVARMQQDIASAEADSTKKQVQASALASTIEKLRKEVAKCGEQRAQLMAAQDEKMAEFKALEDAAFKVLEVVKATQELMGRKEGELAQIRTEFEQHQRQVEELCQAEVDLGSSLETQKLAAREEGAKVKSWTAKFAKYASSIEERTGEAPVPLEADQITATNAQELQYRITSLEEELAEMNINLEAIEAWRKADSECIARTADLEAATAERDTVRKEYEELKKRRLDEFMMGFNTISLKLKEMYQMITLGGDAELELVDSLDPFSEGILFSVRPPKKSWKNIANLSGGEKTLSSLSLVFALHHYKPTPLYVMDEIDAALDFKNVSIVGHYIKERTKNAQFVIISLRNNMFELADRLVGIYKTDNATKSVAINPGQFQVGLRTQVSLNESGGSNNSSGGATEHGAAASHHAVIVS